MLYMPQMFKTTKDLEKYIWGFKVIKNLIEFLIKYTNITTFETLLLLNFYQRLVTNLLISNIFSRDPIPIDNCKWTNTLGKKNYNK